MTRPVEGLPPLRRYTLAAERASAQIISAYSTSFGAATRLLGRRNRRHVRNIYALVRVADELVDGVADEAGLGIEQQHGALNALEKETIQAIGSGYSSNPVVHAFARTARSAQIDENLLHPFFASMRADIVPPVDRPTDTTPAAGDSPVDGIAGFGPDAHAEYVYGSAEVVGLMCLRVFLRDSALNETESRLAEEGARQLGAAFQNVNFLRDLADDTDRLGRSYLRPEGRLTQQDLNQWVRTIREQLRDARQGLPLLPRDARNGVSCALALFSRLTDRLAQTPVDELYNRRVRLSGFEKAIVILRALLQQKSAVRS